MFKNKLKEIMEERGTTSKQLEETGLSRQTISIIKNNEFHVMHQKTINKLLNYFNILYGELGTIISDQEYLFHMLKQKEFNEAHIAYLEELLLTKKPIQKCYVKSF